MNDTQPIWLPHLAPEMVKDWYGKTAGPCIALEAWRRGLSVTIKDKKFIQMEISRTANLSGPYQPDVKPSAKTLSLKASCLVGPKFNMANQISKDKDWTKRVLAEAGVIVPQGERFGPETSNEVIAAYAEKLGYPVVLKPRSGTMGKGVIANIRDTETLLDELRHVREELNLPDVLIEEYVPGDEYRVLVVGDKVFGAVNRIPANIKGNGINTIQELIEIKNRERKKNPNLYKSLIKTDKEVMDYIKRAGYSLDAVLADGEQLFLRSKSNVSAGGEPVDATDELSEAVKETAVGAVRAVPGLQHAGLDIIVDHSKGTDTPGVVIEINTRPMIGLHLYPIKGQARDIPRAIIDYHFPETAAYNKNRINDHLYFNKNAIEPITNGAAAQLTLRPSPSAPVCAKRCVVHGHVQGVGYRKWIAKKTQSLELYGYCKNLKNGSVEVVAASHCPDRLRKLAELCGRGPSKAQVTRVEEFDWEGPVNIGFEIKQDSNDTQKAKIAREVQMLNNKIKKLEKQLKKEKRKRKKVTQSATWRFTSPLRKISRTIRNMF